MLDVAGIERPGLSRTSFTVPDGGIATIMGPSGSGKSLLLRAIADMDPNDGGASVDGILRSSVPAHEWRRMVAYLPAENGWWSDAVAAIRMIVQLSLVGLVLKAGFAIASPWLTLLIAVIMCGFAGREIMARQDDRLKGIWGWSIGAVAMTTGAAIVTVIALTSQIHADPWWQPRFALPLFGMILGNVMIGTSLGLHTLTGDLKRDRATVEAQLLLGANRWTATAPVVRRALKNGFMPIINSMSAIGIVFLPGMMTGQILAGVDPQQAVKYQLLIMFLIAGATGLGVLLAVFGMTWRLTDSRDRLRLDRLAPAPRVSQR